MAGNNGQRHSFGEILDLTDEQLAAVDRIREILDTLPRGRRRVFQEYLEGQTDAEEDRGEENDIESSCNEESETCSHSDDAGNGIAGD